MTLQDILNRAITRGISILDLSKKNLGDQHMRELAEFLQEHGASFTGLKLDENRFGQGGGHALAKALPYCPALKQLSLKECGISQFGGVAGEAILRALRSHTTPFSLNLAENGMNDATAYEVVALLRSAAPIRGLHLGSYDFITDAGTIAIVRAITAHPTLKRIDMSGNGLTAASYVAIGEMLKFNQSLTGFEISQGISDSKALNALAEGILANKNLLHFQITKNAAWRLPETAQAHIAANRRAAQKYATLLSVGNPIPAELHSDAVGRASAIASKLVSDHGKTDEESYDLVMQLIRNGEELSAQHTPHLLTIFGVRKTQEIMMAHQIPFSAEDLTSPASLAALEKSGRMMEIFNGGIEFHTSAQLNRCLAKISHEQRAEIPGLHVLKARLQNRTVVPVHDHNERSR